MSLLWEETFDYRGEECVAFLAEEKTDNLKWNTAVVKCEVRGVKHIDRRSTEHKWGRWWFGKNYTGEESHINQAIEDFKDKVDRFYEDNNDQSSLSDLTIKT